MVTCLGVTPVGARHYQIISYHEPPDRTDCECIEATVIIRQCAGRVTGYCTTFGKYSTSDAQCPNAWEWYRVQDEGDKKYFMGKVHCHIRQRDQLSSRQGTIGCVALRNPLVLIKSCPNAVKDPTHAHSYVVLLLPVFRLPSSFVTLFRSIFLFGVPFSIAHLFRFDCTPPTSSGILASVRESQVATLNGVLLSRLT